MDFSLATNDRLSDQIQRPTSFLDALKSEHKEAIRAAPLFATVPHSAKEKLIDFKVKKGNFLKLR